MLQTELELSYKYAIISDLIKDAIICSNQSDVKYILNRVLNEMGEPDYWEEKECKE